MASSVSSEHTFLSAGITISKHCNWLKGDIVEALQCLKSEEEQFLEEDIMDELMQDQVAQDKNAFSWDQIIVDNVADSDKES
ncbi:hypothetical protein BDZ94DRAFT_1314666 [Collybia nuda]|uniref:HAT C-terminal dimerisation domain-containing protein n=1 Tax=Collybia nuda TaxID=64659 RepID=A0A9P5XST2_9AGAR|nr:hypothetical protein BDZ94DRAFT_1314666 [Collybia nuda]